MCKSRRHVLQRGVRVHTYEVPSRVGVRLLTFPYRSRGPPIVHISAHKAGAEATRALRRESAMDGRLVAQEHAELSEHVHVCAMV